MAEAAVTLGIRFRWWLRPYLCGVILMARLTGCKPDPERFVYWIDRSIKYKVALRKVGDQ